jgi:hypothetical protein
MSRTRIQYIADFDTNSGVVESSPIFKDEAPGLGVQTTTHGVNDITDISNFAISGYVRFSDIAGGKARVVFGATVAGVGKAIDFVMSGAGWKVQYVDITTFDGAATAVNQEVDFMRRAFEYYSDVWYKFQIIAQGTNLRVIFDGKECFDLTNFAPAGTYVGIAGIDTASFSYFSDLEYWHNQVFYGNVNINGVPQPLEGRAIMFHQTFYNVVEYTATNANGDYMIFIQDDPTNLNKYFLIGYVDNRRDIQPRGVANITL